MKTELICGSCKQPKPLQDFGALAHKGLYRGTWDKKPQCRECFDDKYLNPIRVKSASLLHKAIKEGNIRKPIRCAYCQKIVRLDAHHFNYEEPFFVIWYCRSCHQKWHKYGL